tara:strand:- start:4939 stop:7422 length:2484 start_codon:yes stop_codon:yes gene_type:complete
METYEITVDGQKYRTQANSEEGARIKIQTYLSEQKIKDEITDEQAKSGIGDAILSGLTNDEGYKTRWLAEKRFPELLEQGEDPMDLYFIDADEDIAYVDPEDGEIKKEFREGIFGADVEDIFGKVGPTLQFASEVGFGTLGLIGGGLTGGIPGAMAGGSGGTGFGGTLVYGARAGTSELFNGPPLNVEKATKDLAISSAFGGIPLGAPAKSFGAFSENIIKRFPGAEGRTALKDIVESGGKTADEKIAYAQEKYGITLTRAEAEGTVTNASAIQKYLQMQPRADKLWEFYHTRNVQVEETAEGFFNELFSGKYVRSGTKNKLTGKESLDASMDVAEAAEAFLKESLKRRKTRASAIYDDAFELDINFDIADIAKNIDDKLANKNVKGPLRKALETVKESLIDQNTGVLKNTTKDLHESLTQDFTPLLEGLTKDGQKFIKREITMMRNEVSKRLKNGNDIYRKASAVYDPTKGHLQQLERSVVRQLAEAVEKGGAQAGRLTQRLFNGTISPKEIKDLKRILQAEFVDADGVTQSGAQAWQNLKGTWLMTQFDDAVAGTVNPLGASNKFLSKLGIRQVDAAFPRVQGTGTRRIQRDRIRARGKKAKILEAMFEPDELANFVDLAEIMQSVSYIATQSQSPTQSLQAMSKLLQQEGMSRTAKAAGVVKGLVNLPSRFIARGFDDIGQNIISKQKEAYEDELIEALINPERAAELRKYFDNINPKIYYYTQTLARGGAEALDEIFNENQARLNEIIDIEKAEPSFGPLETEQPTEDLQGALNQFQMPNIDQPLFDEPSPDLTLQQTLSPTILPDELDREIAMRGSGIAGLG